jgi:hypothetical protein
MKSELEILVEEYMIIAGYDPTIWADVLEYWRERLD